MKKITLYAADYFTKLVEEKFKLNENINISKNDLKCRCIWCRSFIEGGEWCFSFSNVEDEKGRWKAVGRGAKLHLECFNILFNKLDKLKEEAVKKIVLKGLK